MRFHNNFAKALLAMGLTLGISSAQNSGTSNAQPASSSATSQGKGNGGSGVDTTSLVGQGDRRFMTEAAQGGLAEVQLAQLAQQKSTSDSVKQVAQMIEKDHTAANAELKQLAQQKNVDLPADVGAKNQAIMTKLQALSGEKFDKAYVKAMKADHKMDIKKFQAQADKGMDSDVKAFAVKTLPALKNHLQGVEQMASNAHHDSSMSHSTSGSSSSSTTGGNSATGTGSTPTTK